MVLLFLPSSRKFSLAAEETGKTSIERFRYLELLVPSLVSCGMDSLHSEPSRRSFVLL